MTKKYLFFLGHPAHLHLFKNIITRLKADNHKIKVLIKSKDILENLCIKEGIEYINILPIKRKSNYLSIIKSFFIKYYRIAIIIRDFRPNLLISSEPTFSHLGKIFKIRSIIFSEDDAEIIPLYAWITYPFTDVIFSPNSCSAGRWDHKKISYNGFHKLCYLHPSVFKPQRELIKHLGNKYFILRFSELDAYHDKNIRGISKSLAIKIVDLLRHHGKVYITSEGELDSELKQYQININPGLIHHALFYADLYIGDSQSMAVESALLGTPGVRFSDFSGKIGVLNELEYKYNLTKSIDANNPDKLLYTISKILDDHKYKNKIDKNMKLMLKEKINVLDFAVDFIKKY